jgi:hypothetical protein
MSQANQMSQVCAIAHKIYYTWKNQGRDALKKYFINELGFPHEEAIAFSCHYDPGKAPSAIYPIDAFKSRKGSSVIFDELSLRFESETIWPRNLLGWSVMRHVFGTEVINFTFGENACKEQRKNHIFFHALPCDENGNPVPLGLAAIETTTFEELPVHVLRKSRLLCQNLGRSLGTDLAKLLLRADIVFPSPKEIYELSRTIQRGLNKEELVITGAFCPDYAYKQTNDPVIPFEYTFKGVSGGVGLVAQQFQRVVPHLHKFFLDNDIPHRFVFSIGDFEANSPAILDRVGLSRKEFVRHCQSSLEAFRESLPDISMQLHLFQQEVANGRWTRYVQEAYQAMLSGDFGSIKTNTGKDPIHEVEFIANSGRNFYNSWYGKEHALDELTQLVIAQGSEYAAMGRIIAEDFAEKPVIQIAGDRAKMQTFNAMYSDHITLCTKRVY